ncbi:3-carboxy-cis,cis-muconate cycloisomerase [Aquabacterium sp.]|uniref:3-carboxy-cis,cis-muconate cycloisomerase n=1 Tax=Aquabacterium sp. TaxID=1872578 RepID=UPI0025C1E511|nr:3-carboxy-cis,cis-muconate cycloisomerase [Aquabacterium sp.]
MTTLLFDQFLSTDAMAEAFDGPRLIQAMLDFEAALAKAEADEGLIPPSAAEVIARACDVSLYDPNELARASRSAGSLAIPLVKALTARTAELDAEAARHVHKGGTSQDVIDTGNALLTKQALNLIDASLTSLIDRLLGIAEQHADTPILARTLMQPATVTTLGFKMLGWIAPLQRSRAALTELADLALALQLGGAVGTLSALGDKGPAVSRRMAQELGLALPDGCWHTQRDTWMRLGAEVGILTGTLGKIATDLSLMAQGEIGELAEPSGAGRGGSSAMPHKRNPVSSMVALAAFYRAPGRVATMLSTMAQEHERGLGNWQAELAEWPHLFMGAHGALQALNDAFQGLIVDPARMRANIDSLLGLVFAEAAGAVLAKAIGRAAAHHELESLSREAAASGTHLLTLTLARVQASDALRGQVDEAALRLAFEPSEAARHATHVTRERLQRLRAA